MKNRTIPRHAVKVSKADIARITKKMKKEFPGDWALQQVHIARLVILKEAKLAKMSLDDYHAYLSECRNRPVPAPDRKKTTSS